MRTVPREGGEQRAEPMDGVGQMQVPLKYHPGHNARGALYRQPARTGAWGVRLPDTCSRRLRSHQRERERSETSTAKEQGGGGRRGRDGAAEGPPQGAALGTSARPRSRERESSERSPSRGG